MNEKYKHYLKKLGIAGFLFFLIKGILWLIFGSALYKWLKSLIILSSLCLLPYASPAQLISERNNSLPLQYVYPINIKKQKFENFNIAPTKSLPFFCRLESKLNPKKKQRLSFRLGSLDYTNRIEYFKPSLVQ